MSRKQPPPQDTPPRRPPRQTREAAPPERPARAPSKPKAQPKRRPSQPAPEKRAKQPRRRRRRFLRPAQIAALILVLLAGLVAIDPSLLDDILPGGGPAQTITNTNAPLASFYAPAVMHWEPQIKEWAREYGVNPNVIAIVMQIESCGDPAVISPAGAMGLMQVMPFHFSNGENMLNPDTNMRRGLNVFHECLREFADWDIGLALACYNGGPSVTLRPRETWARETQSYYRWATGLWNEVTRGHDSSDTLDQWLRAGGSSLCTRAANTLADD